MRRRRAVAAALAASALVPLSHQTLSTEAFAETTGTTIPIALKAHSKPLERPSVTADAPSSLADPMADVREIRRELQRAAVREAERAAKRAAAKRAAARRAADARREAAEPDFVKPTDGELTSGFGARWGTSHNGIDLANSLGTPIYAVADGTVVEAGPASGFGLWVQVEHDDGTITVYGHMYEFSVQAGQRVKAGQQIAEIGDNGQSTGPHLHFEVWQGGGAKVDPLPWLAEHGVRI